jgi:molybdopterin converting factor small subunit
MMEYSAVAVVMYGIFTESFGARTVRVDLVLPCSVAALKEALSQRLSATQDIAALLSQSVLADDTNILSDRDVVDGTRVLALLPPVCGG